MREYPVTTDEFWSIDGYPLHQFAHNIESWGGSRQGAPEFDGDDHAYGDWAGERWRRKNPGSRVISLEGWVTGGQRAGSVRSAPMIPPYDETQVMRQNWYMLRRLLWNPYRQIAVTKRFRRPSDLQIIEVTAMAEFAGGLEPKAFSPSGAFFSVDLKLADPFFYGPLVSGPSFANQSLAINSPMPEPAQVYVDGDYSPKGVQVQFNSGGSTNPIFKIENNPAAGGVPSSAMIANLVANVNYTLEVDTGRITPTGPTVRSWTGRKMLELNPGANAIRFAGTGTIRYQEAWL